MLEVSELTFDEHHKGASIYPSWAYKATLTTEHALIQLLVHALILTTAYRSMELAEVEIRDIARRAGCRAGAAAYTRLQLGHLGNDSITLTQVVII